MTDFLKKIDWKSVIVVIGIPSGVFGGIIGGKNVLDMTEPAHLSTHQFTRTAARVATDGLSGQITSIDAKQSEDIGSIWTLVLQSRIDLLRGQLVNSRSQEISLQKLIREGDDTPNTRLQLINVQLDINNTENMIARVWCDFSKHTKLASSC